MPAGKLKRCIDQLRAAAGESPCVGLQDKALLDVTEGVCEPARKRLALSCMVSDCNLVSADGRCFLTHKSRLAEQSGTFRKLFFDLQHATDFPVDESAVELAPLLSYLHAPEALGFGKCRQNDGTLHLAKKLLHLARKYDIPELRTRCDVELAKTDFQTLTNFPLLWTLTTEFGLKKSTAACRAQANMDEITRCHGLGWLEQLPGRAVVQLLGPYVDAARFLAWALQDVQGDYLSTLTALLRNEQPPPSSNGHGGPFLGWGQGIPPPLYKNVRELLAILHDDVRKQLEKTRAQLSADQLPPWLRELCKPVIRVPAKP